MDIKIRKATLSDIDFVIESIIEAEKSGTEKLSFSTIFELTEDEVICTLHNILEKNESGCELSLGNFLIAEDTSGVQSQVACVCGWVEGENDENQPSQTIKANLLSSQLSIRSLMALRRNGAFLRELQVNRPKGSYQLEYVYCRPSYRKLGIVQSLMTEHEKVAKFHGCNEMFILLCAHNQRAIESYGHFGFLEFQRIHSDNIEIKSLLPDNTKLLMRKVL